MDKISSFLIEIGVPADSKGFDYLHDAIEIVMGNSEYRHKTIELYKTIADKYNENYYAVERCIRHAISCCYKRGDKNRMKKIFGDYKYKTGQPKNSEFIAISSLYLKD